MDELTSTICMTLGYGATGQLIDRRDKTVYWIAKLTDGNCWMTQNLSLDLYSANITKENSDITASTWTGAKNVQSGLWSDTTPNIIKWYKSTDTSRSGHESYGNYYSWEAATAGTGSKTGDYQSATSSICPRGWKLPTQSQFAALTSGITVSSALNSSPYYFQYGGLVSSGKLSNAGTNGYYWSSTAGSTSGAYALNFNSSSVRPSNTYDRYYGHPVRCLVLGS